MSRQATKSETVDGSDSADHPGVLAREVDIRPASLDPLRDMIPELLGLHQEALKDPAARVGRAWVGSIRDNLACLVGRGDGA